MTTNKELRELAEKAGWNACRRAMLAALEKMIAAHHEALAPGLGHVSNPYGELKNERKNAKRV